MKRSLAALLVVAVAAAAGWYFFLRPRTGPGAGERAPEVTVTDRATNQPVRIPADLAGQPFALQFFSYT